MVKMINGITSSGSLRFISDVNSGLQSDLHCAHCKSPLIAKKGDQNDWHFAHVSGQTRPECVVGARNFLRMSLKRHVASSGLIPKPKPYPIRTNYAGQVISAELQLAVTDITSWSTHDDSSSKVADIKVSDGSFGEIHLVLSNDPGFHIHNRNRAVLLVVVDESQVLDLSSEHEMASKLLKSATAAWVSISKDSSKYQQSLSEAVKRQSAAAEALKIAQLVPQLAPVERKLESQSERSIATKCVVNDEKSWKDDIRLHWNSERKLTTTIFCLHLRDGTNWFVYVTENGIRKLKPWPELFEGWDEFFPPAIGKASEQAECYVVDDFGDFLAGIRQYVKGMTNTSNPNELPKIFDRYGID